MNDLRESAGRMAAVVRFENNDDWDRARLCSQEKQGLERAGEGERRLESKGE